MGPITKFIDQHYRHFNAAALKDASVAYKEHVEKGGKMFVTLAGAMSSAELGISLAEMIRNDKVHAICCTAANLEEDLFHLVACEHYIRIPNYRYLTKEDDHALYKKHCNRVTDTCIPEEEAMRRLERALKDLWISNDTSGKSMLAHEYYTTLIKNGSLKKYYQKDDKTSWLVAAAEKNLPIFVPGWEDSTTGNMFAGAILKGEVKKVETVKTGIHYMTSLANWYKETSANSSIGFYQIGGGIAGDFPICVVPMMHQDMGVEVPLWGYFCQISDSTTSYGSYSGATPNEKITWGKLGVKTPMFVIESDATIVAPLMFGYVLGW